MAPQKIQYPFTQERKGEDIAQNLEQGLRYLSTKYGLRLVVYEPRPNESPRKKILSLWGKVFPNCAFIIDLDRDYANIGESGEGLFLPNWPFRRSAKIFADRAMGLLANRLGDTNLGLPSHMIPCTPKQGIGNR